MDTWQGERKSWDVMALKPLVTEEYFMRCLWDLGGTTIKKQRWPEQSLLLSLGLRYQASLLQYCGKEYLKKVFKMNY